MRNQMSKDVLMVRMMADLLKIHEEFGKKIDDFSKNIQKQRGPKGDKPSHQEIIDIVTPLLPLVLGHRIESTIRQYMPEVKDGATPTKEELLDLITPLIPKPKKEQKIKQPTAVEIYEMILPFLPKPVDVKMEIENSKKDFFEYVLSCIKDGKKINKSDVNGLTEEITSMWSQIGKSGGSGKMRGGGDTIRQGTNIILTRNADGTVTISATGGTSGSNVTQESLAGVQAGDDVTLTFSGLSQTATSIIQITRNGKVMTPGSTAVDGYVLSGVTSATVYSADAGDTFLVTYSYA